jgi:hypothetical protein
MIGKTQKMRHIATGLTLAALVAALAAPAGASTKAAPDIFERYAAAHPNGADRQITQVYQHAYGRGDARLSQATSQVYQHAYGESDARLSRPTTVQRGFRTDTLDSARVANINLGRAASQAVTYRLPSGFRTDALDRARVAQPQIVPVSSESFDWSDFAIGIGTGVGGLLGLGALATGASRLRQPRHGLGNA